MSLSPKPGSWGDVLAEGRGPRFVLICLGVWLQAADSMVTSTIMPSVGRGLGGFEWFGWATAGYLLGSVLAGASSGLLAQRFGLRRATAWAAVVYAAGCVVSALAPDMLSFLIGRGLQGIGGGWVAGFCAVAIGLMFPDRLLPKVYAATTGVWGIATLVGPLLGGLFADTGPEGWRGVFWCFAIQAGLVALTSLRLLPVAEKGDSGTKIAWWQLAVVGLAVTLIGVADRTGSVGGMIGLTLTGLAALIIMVWRDGKAKVQLLPRAASQPTSVPGAVYLAMFLMTASSMAYGVYAPAILQTLKGYSALMAGYVVAVEALAWTTAGLLVSGLTGLWPGRLMRLGGGLVVASLVLSAWVFPHPHLGLVLLSGTLLGAGFGFSWAFMGQALLSALPTHERALGSAGVTTVRMTGSAIGATGAAAVANLVGVGDALTLQSASAAGFWVFAALTPVALLALWPTWRLGQSRSDQI